VIARALLAAAAVAWLTSCDESQVWHEPRWSLERMMEQPRVDPYDPGASQAPAQTIARGEGPSLKRPRLDRALVEQGQRAFVRVCAPCHGILGDGDSVVATKMVLRAPPSLMEPRLRVLSDEQIHEVVDRGYGLMPPYVGQMTYDERWAVVAYVRALQIAEGAPVAELPAAMRGALAREAP
jgi:mono/diheme cytochrome c family protein